jgi:hypothetical protein
LHAVEVEDSQHFAATVELDLHGRSQSFPMRFAIVDREARRIAGEITLKRSGSGSVRPRSSSIRCASMTRCTS